MRVPLVRPRERPAWERSLMSNGVKPGRFKRADDGTRLRIITCHDCGIDFGVPLRAGVYPTLCGPCRGGEP